MTQNHADEDEEFRRKVKRLKDWVHLLTTLFRIIIVIGMMLFILTLALTLFLSFISGWILIFPLSIIGIGIILARIEYHLYQRMVELTPGEMEGDDEDEDTAVV